MDAPTTHGRRLTGGRFAVAAVLLASTAACVPEPSNPPPEAPTISVFEVLGAPHTAPALVPLRWEVSDPQDDAITCRLDGDGDGIWEEDFDPCPSSTSRNVDSVDAGTHTARLEVSDGSNTTVATANYAVAAPSSYEGFDIVIRQAGPLDDDVVAALESAAKRWEHVIARGVSDMAVALPAGSCGGNSAAFDDVVDDVIINVSMFPTAPAAAGTFVCVTGPDGLPRASWIEIDPSLLVNLRTLNIVDEVMLHELGHALGFGFYDPYYDWISDVYGDDPRFNGPRAVAESAALGRLGGIPVSAIGGVAQPHWEGSMVGGEIMSHVPDGAALSRITIAAMADLGYSVNLDAADPYVPQLPPGTCVIFSDTVSRCW